MPPTKERIMDAAGQIFGRDGYKAATIRKIAAAAQANVAAINYHFQDKQGLYLAVLEDTFSKGFQRFPATRDTDTDKTPEQRLRVFIQTMFHRFLSNQGWGGISGRGKLIAREFFEPTPAFENIIKTYIAPHKAVLMSIISELSPDKADVDKQLGCAISIIGQCVYYAFATPIIQRIAPDFMPTQQNLDRLADHVFWFSLGGIQQINNTCPKTTEIQEKQP